MINLDKIEKNVRTRNQEKVDAGDFLGCILGIWDKNGKLFEESFGHRTLEKTEKITDKTVFRLASMTKPVTGVSFMQQLEKGKLTLDDPVSKWIPEFKNMKVATKVENRTILATEDAEREITPRMLLTHSAGVGCGLSYGAHYRPIKKELSLEKSVRNYAKCALDFQPGTKHIYSPVWGLDIIAHLVEMMSDMPYEDYIKRFIFGPLGMTDTAFLPSDEQVARCMQVVTKTDDGLVEHNLPSKIGFYDFEEGAASGGAGLFSTLSDYSRFARMLLNDGCFDGEKILDEKSVRIMSSPQLPLGIEGVEEHLNWGLGMRIHPKTKKDVQPLPAGSFGFSGFFGTHFWVDKQNDITAVYLMNISNGGDISELPKLEFEKDVMSGIG